jgi:hypothetical protein
MQKRGYLATIALCAALLGGPLSAQTPLRDVAHVRDGILHVGMAHEISEKCSSISPRIFRGLGFLRSLERHARDLGYTEEEIDAYINDEAEKDRLEAIGRQALAEMGVVEGDEATWCAVGRAEIAASSRIGWLLR